MRGCGLGSVGLEKGRSPRRCEDGSECACPIKGAECCDQRKGCGVSNASDNIFSQENSLRWRQPLTATRVELNK